MITFINLAGPLHGYDVPTQTFQSPIIKSLVALMDKYRELRLFWHFVDFFVVLALIIAVAMIAARVQKIRSEIHQRQDELAELIANTSKATDTTTKVYNQINAMESRTISSPDKELTLLRTKRGHV